VKWYQEALTKHSDKFEIIFVSSDRDDQSFKDYHGEMPWLAVPFDDKNRAKALNKLFEVDGIPAFVIVEGDTGKLVNANGRGVVTNDPDANEFPWYPKPANDLSNPEGINDTVSVVVFAEESDAETKESLKQSLIDLATKVHSATPEDEDKPLFFYAFDGSGAAVQIRRLIGQSDTSKAIAIVLDIPDSGGYYVLDKPVTAEALAEFWSGYTSKSLTRQQLS
jgi:nucleoredoxin